MIERSELQTAEDQAAYDLCLAIGVEPWDCVPKYERRFLGYDGDYYMNWARDRVEEFMALRKAMPQGSDNQ